MSFLVIAPEQLPVPPIQPLLQNDAYKSSHCSEQGASYSPSKQSLACGRFDKVTSKEN